MTLIGVPSAPSAPPRMVMPEAQLLVCRVVGFNPDLPEADRIQTKPMPKIFMVGMVFLAILHPFNVLNAFKCIVDPLNPKGMALVPLSPRWFGDWVQSDKDELTVIFQKQFMSEENKDAREAEVEAEEAPMAVEKLD